MADEAVETITIDTEAGSSTVELQRSADPDETTVFLKCNLGQAAQAKLDAIQRETRANRPTSTS